MGLGFLNYPTGMCLNPSPVSFRFLWYDPTTFAIAMRPVVVALLSWRFWWAACTFKSARGAPTSIAVTSMRGQCFSLIFSDGYAHQCFEVAKISRVPLDQMRASEALLMLYDMSTGRIRDMSLIPPGFEGMIEPPPLPAEATANADGTAAVANANDAPLFHLLWPKPGETVTTRDIDFRFDWSMPPDTSPVPGAAALCVVLSKSTNGSEFRAHVTNATAAAAGDLEMDTMVVIRCSENTVSDGLGNVLTLTLTHSGRYALPPQEVVKLHGFPSCLPPAPQLPRAILPVPRAARRRGGPQPVAGDGASGPPGTLRAAGRGPRAPRACLRGAGAARGLAEQQNRGRGCGACPGPGAGAGGYG